MNGLEHIQSVFAQTKGQGRSAFMPYFTLGFPDAEQSVAIIKSLADSGADLIELGLPFSDPLADGPTIQHSTQIALEKGMSMRKSLSLVKELRVQGVQQPLMLMGYINPILAYGATQFVHDAALAGADGLIIPDMPPEEAEEIQQACKTENLALVFLLAPTSTPERIAKVAALSSGFIYLVAVTGITGERKRLDPGLADFIKRVRQATDTPLVVGFGISTPEQVKEVGELADGVIAGSAIIRLVEQSAEPVQAVKLFMQKMKAA